MARRNDFRPDPQGTRDFGKLLLTKKQRRDLLRWSLYAIVCLSGLLLQDVILCRVRLFGAPLDIVPCLILMVCILQGAEDGSIFILAAACFYYFSGSAPGVYAIPILVTIGVLLVIFRQAYMSQGFFTILFSSAFGMLVYELCVFAIGLFLGLTSVQRLQSFAITALISLIVVPVAYPIFISIGKIGGDTWKE